MKVAYIIVLFICVDGISNTKIAQAESGEYKTDDAEISFIPDSFDAFIWLLESKGEVKNFKEGCARYRGNEGYNGFKRSIKNFVSSASKVDNRLRRSLPERGAGAIEEILIFVKEVCSEFVPNLLRDTKILISSYRNCLDPEARADVPIDGGLGLRLFEYICRNNGSHILGVFGDSNSDCQKTAEPEIDDCMKEASITNFAKENAVGLRMNLLTSVGPNLRYCQYTEKVRKCYVESLNKCTGNVKVAEISDAVNQIVEKQKSCDELLKNKTEPLWTAGWNTFDTPEVIFI